MIREITIGQYYPVDSVLHRLDPRVKLSGTIIFLISLFISESFYLYLFAAVSLFLLIILSHVPPKYIFKGLKGIFVLLIISVLFNMFLTQGECIFSFGPLKLTREGLYQALKMGARLILLVTGSSLMTLTTTPNQLTDGLEKGLGLLKRIHVPVHEIAMMMSIALRFIPILIEETDKIIKAQMARGADFESGSLIKRAKAMVPVLVPLFISAFRRANDLALAMEARCYHGGEGRTKMKPLKYSMRDYIAYFIIFLYISIFISSLFLLK